MAGAHPQPAAALIDHGPARDPGGAARADREGRRQQARIPPGAVEQIVASHPEWAGFSTNEVGVAFALQQFLITFLILPGYIPLAIASYSIVGEKQSRSLEAVLATPIRTTDLLAGKAIAALVPAILATWIAYGTSAAIALPARRSVGAVASRARLRDLFSPTIE